VFQLPAVNAFRSPLDSVQISDLAERQLADYRRGSPGTVFAEGVELSIEDAYAVQLEVARLRVADGETVTGFKVGCTGEHVQAQFGMRGPVSGHLWRDELRPSRSWVSASRFSNLAVEAEVALRLDADGGVAAAFPVVELHDYVLRGTPPTLAELVANNAIHAGVVLPAEERAGGASLPGDSRLELVIDGEVVEAGGPFPMAGGAEASLAWLRAHLAALGLALPPRALVLAGTPLHIVAVQPGTRVQARVAGMETEARVVA
jgi:2-keto-4-pentenoate hydratase